MSAVADSVRDKALQDYRKKLLEHKEVESRLKESELNADFKHYLAVNIIYFFFFISSRIT